MRLTALVDVDLERRVGTVLCEKWTVERLLGGRTVLLVTHRAELEARADRVVRLGAEEVQV